VRNDVKVKLGPSTRFTTAATATGAGCDEELTLRSNDFAVLRSSDLELGDVFRLDAHLSKFVVLRKHHLHRPLRLFRDLRDEEVVTWGIRRRPNRTAVPLVDVMNFLWRNAQAAGQSLTLRIDSLSCAVERQLVAFPHRDAGDRLEWNRARSAEVVCELFDDI